MDEMNTYVVPSPLVATHSSSILHSLCYDAVVFLVGNPSPKRFTVHKSKIEPRSEFVHVVLRGQWRESQSCLITLSDDDPHVFSVYQRWLYNGKIYTSTGETAVDTEEEYGLLVRACILGEKFLDPDFKDAVIDAIIEKIGSQQRLNICLSKLVFDNTSAASPLRRLWVTIYQRFGSAEWLDPSLTGDSLCFDFLLELSKVHMQKSAGFVSDAEYGATLLNCTYHEHGPKPCYRSKYTVDWLS